jgi:DNA-binding response OmpR family regulator
MKKILIIDDEGAFCSLIKENLEITGDYEVICATDGKGGIRAALEQRPDLILLDIMMPVMDGFKVLKILKSDEKTLSIPVIMLTAKDDDESKREAARLFDDRYIIKPVEIAVLRSTIEQVLSIRSKGEE